MLISLKNNNIIPRESKKNMLISLKNNNIIPRESKKIKNENLKNGLGTSEGE